MGQKWPTGARRFMDIKLSNGKKTIIRSKAQYEANKENYKARGFTPFSEKKSVVKEVVELALKPKAKKKNVKKTKKKV